MWPWISVIAHAIGYALFYWYGHRNGMAAYRRRMMRRYETIDGAMLYQTRYRDDVRYPN